MTDPAVEAAQRAWRIRCRSGSDVGLSPDSVEILAAREALAPLRELHRPFDRTTAPWRMHNDPHTIVCHHCLGPIEWPCATARFIYREDEL